jgi:predicted peptidase
MIVPQLEIAMNCSAKKSIATGLTIWFLAAIAIAAECDPSSSSTQKAQQLNRTITVKLAYLLYLPKGYEQKESWPLMLFLHGAGERGDDLEMVKKHGPPKLIDAGREFPFVVVSPQCPKDRMWEAYELSALLDEIVEKYKIDQDQVFVTGLSMGGYGTWALAGHSPARFAAIVPICGGGETIFVRRYAKTLPVWVFHGAKDTAVPLERSERMVEALKKAGGEPKFTIYPEAAHDSWTETYDNPELYAWLLEQRRKPVDAK